MLKDTGYQRWLRLPRHQLGGWKLALLMFLPPHSQLDFLLVPIATPSAAPTTTSRMKVEAIILPSCGEQSVGSNTATSGYWFKCSRGALSWLQLLRDCLKVGHACETSRAAKACTECASGTKPFLNVSSLMDYFGVVCRKKCNTISYLRLIVHHRLTRDKITLSDAIAALFGVRGRERYQSQRMLVLWDMLDFR